MQKLSEVHPYVWHYTNEKGLYGILESNCLWATHFKFLNDSSEIFLFKKELVNHLLPRMKLLIFELARKWEIENGKTLDESNIELAAIQETEGFVTGCYDALFNSSSGLKSEVYVISFCKGHENDYVAYNGLLSQWRGYGGEGGYAVVFESSVLEERLQQEHSRFKNFGFIFGDVVYSHDPKSMEREFSNELSDFSSYVIKMYKSFVERKELPFSDSILNSFINCTSRFKHRGFEEENEVRIVSVIHNISEDESLKKEKERKFREFNGKRIPYIELFSDLEKKLPIVKIIVGPHKNKQLRAETLKVWLRNNGLEGIDVSVSDIPYV